MAFNFSNSAVQSYHGDGEVHYRTWIFPDVFLLLNIVDLIWLNIPVILTQNFSLHLCYLQIKWKDKFYKTLFYTSMYYAGLLGGGDEEQIKHQTLLCR